MNAHEHFMNRLYHHKVKYGQSDFLAFLSNEYFLSLLSCTESRMYYAIEDGKIRTYAGVTIFIVSDYEAPDVSFSLRIS